MLTPISWVRYSLLFIGVATLMMLSRVLSGDWTLWVWDLVSLFSVYLVLMVISRIPASWKTVFKWMIVVYCLGLGLATVYAGILQLLYGSAYERVRLFLPNENILAATLVVAFLAVSVFHRRWWVMALLFLTLLAVVLTGSRTAFIALLVSSFIWLLISRYSLRQKVIAVLAVLMPLILGGLAVRAIAAEKLPQDERNLLRSSGHFDASYWKKQHAESLQIFPNTVLAPREGNTADRLVGSSKDKAILLLQLVATSKPDQSYVGSLYMRSDEPQEIVLYALGQVTCHVTTQWQRCVTPAATGNGKTPAQLRLQTLLPNQAVDIELWGAQLEYGDKASDLVIKDPSLTNYLKRFAVTLWSSDTGVSSRQGAARIAWNIFLDNPIAGVGISHFNTALKPLAGDNQALARMTHAHNLPLHVLATQGILGFAALLLFMGGTLLAVRQQWTRVLPLVVGLCLLNLTDMTLYSGSIYYCYWLTMGLLMTYQRRGSIASAEQ
jgi:O-antigen ligase